MAVRRRRPLVPPPYPRRNRYTPLSSEQSPLVSVSAVSLRLIAKTALAPLLLLFPSQTLRWFVMGALGIWAKSARSPLAANSFCWPALGTVSAAKSAPYWGLSWDIWQDINGDCSTSRRRNVLQFHDISGFGEFHHQLHRRDLGQQPVELIKQPGRVDGPARLGGPQGPAATRTWSQ